MAWFEANSPDVTTGQNGLPRSAGTAINQNPLFDPGTNITPGVDLPLGGSTTPTTPTATTSTVPTTFDAAWLNSIFPGETLSHEMLLAKEAELNKLGVKVLRNAEGRAGKLQFPDGTIADVVQGGGTGLNRKQFLVGGSGGAGGGVLGGLGQGFGGMTAPFTGVFGAPNQAELESTPGYQFARDQGLQAIDRSAAAKGTLLTGGTLKDLAGYAGGIASQNYNNVFNQGLQTFQTNRDSFYHNQDSPFNKLYQVSALGRPTTP